MLSSRITELQDNAGAPARAIGQDGYVLTRDDTTNAFVATGLGTDHDAQDGLSNDGQYLWRCGDCAE